MKTSICAIIISYNCDEKILSGINIIRNQVDYVVIVDNGSNEKSINILKEIAKVDLKIIYNSRNMGIACALNQGVKYAKDNKFDWVITLDQDSLATEDIIENMLNVYKSLDEDQKTRVVSLVPEHIEEKFYTKKRDTSNPLKFEETLADVTSGNLVKTSLFDKVGYFDEKLFIDYVDHEFCLRICKNGYKILKVDNSILLHNLGDYQFKKIFSRKIYYTNHSFTRRYYITRNRLYVWNLYKEDFS